jgi:hypothetical protein
LWSGENPLCLILGCAARDKKRADPVLQSGSTRFRFFTLYVEENALACQFPAENARGASLAVRGVFLIRITA